MTSNSEEGVCYYVRNTRKFFNISRVRTIIFPVVAYECETWSLTLTEKRRLAVSDNGVMRIFGPKRDELIWESRKPHNEELNDPYSSSNIVRVIKSRRMRWARHVVRIEDRRGVYSVLVGNLREKGHFENPVVVCMIILRWSLWKWDVGLLTASGWLRTRAFGGHLSMR